MKSKIPVVVIGVASLAISLSWVNAWANEDDEARSARSGVTDSTRIVEADVETSTEDLAVRMHAGVSSVTPGDPFAREIGRVSFTTCMPCHGTQAQGDRTVFAPPLAGQALWYLDRQLESFRLGIRGGHPNDVHGAVMHPMARAVAISEAQASIFETIADFPAHDPKPEIAGNIEAGAEIFESLCARCHGEQGGGNEDEGAPRLNILPDWYIIRQLENFQAGFRGAHEASEAAQKMRPQALTVMETDEMRNVAAYIQTLEVSGSPVEE